MGVTLWLWLPFFRVEGAAYVHEELSPRLVQLSHGACRLHFNLRCLHGAHDKGILFLLRTTLKSGDAPEFDVPADGGVGVIVTRCSMFCGGDEGGWKTVEVSKVRGWGSCQSQASGATLLMPGLMNKDCDQLALRESRQVEKQRRWRRPAPFVCWL